jgi:hypothetical protein
MERGKASGKPLVPTNPATLRSIQNLNRGGQAFLVFKEV